MFSNYDMDIAYPLYKLGMMFLSGSMSDKGKDCLSALQFENKSDYPSDQRLVAHRP